MPVSAEISYARAEKALRDEVVKFDQQPGKLFFDVGRKFTKGEPQQDFALRMHVERKAEQGAHCIEKHCLDGLVPTDVIESSFVQAVGDSDSGAKILSEGNVVEFGTLGLGVFSHKLRDKFLMTCAHVLSSRFPPLDVADVLERDLDFLGLMSDNFDRFFSYSDDLDVGLFFPSVTLDDSELGRFDPASLPSNVPVPSKISDPRSEDVFGQPNPTIVYKVGATDGRLTTGFIDSVNLTSPIPIIDGANVPGLNRPPFASTQSHFLVRTAHNQGAFAEKGDSGSIVFTGDGRILGMVRAISNNAGTNPPGFRAVVTKMTRIRSEFEISVLS